MGRVPNKVFMSTSSAKAEANQNRGRSDFQTSYTETLTAKETGAIVESARVPRIDLAQLCPSVLVNPAVSKATLSIRVACNVVFVPSVFLHRLSSKPTGSLRSFVSCPPLLLGARQARQHFGGARWFV